MKYLVAVLFAFASTANAYPSNVRLGYPSCAGCHVNGSGGGSVTNYGRMAGAHGTATWAGEHEGGLFHGALGDPEDLPDWFLFDGNARSAAVRTLGVTRTIVPMQADVDLALSPVKGLWLVGSAGVYGQERKREYRRHYVKLDMSEYVSARVGKFLPVYGLGFDDHTLASRQALGFGEGREAYAMEVSARTSFGEAIATQTFGNAGSLALGQTYEYQTPTECVTLAKVGAFLGSRAQVGGSYLRAVDTSSVREAWGGYAIVAPVAWTWLMADVNRLAVSRGQPTLVSTGVVGVEVWRGVDLSATHERIGDGLASYGAELRLTPRPHFELTGRVKRQGDVVTSILVTHYNL